MLQLLILTLSLYGFLYNSIMEGGLIMTVVIYLVGLVALSLFVYLTYILLRGDNE